DVYKRQIHPDGSLHWLMARARGLYNTEGKPVGMLGMIIDISDRKQTEEELRELSTALEIRVQERTRELQESEERFRSAFDNAVNGMALVSPDGHFLKVNPALCKILGYSEQELLQELSCDRVCHPDDLEHYLNAQHQILAGEVSTIQIEKRCLHKLGDTIWVICSASLVRDPQGEPLYLVMQIQDITERRAIEKMKNEFISLVSHELRTPLASIRGSLGLLAAGVLENEPEAAKQMLEIAASESERLVRLVNDILDLERLEANKVTLNQHWCEAENLIQQAIEILRPLTEENNITISLLSARVKIWADRDRIIQVLVNILSNAVKFSLPGTTVTISAQNQADQVLFTVKDQGRGIPADKLENIFSKFQQVDASDSRQKGGTGLGLAICRKIVQQHGGRIWAESILGKGSTFYFTLPIPLE
ncbi:MAG: PAS domain S-box protein, partial [Fischerella sp.]|nr:PAS domain S-box protein [Fischerella sp.]